MKPKFKEFEIVRHILTKEKLLIIVSLKSEYCSKCKCLTHRSSWEDHLCFKGKRELRFDGNYKLRKQNYETIILGEKELKRGKQ